MTIKQIEKKLEKLGFWIISEEVKLKNNGIFQLQKIETGEILEEKYNIESLENKIERLEA